MQALPAEIFDALRERLFVRAVTVGNAGVVSAMLALNVDPTEPTMTLSPDKQPIAPFKYAVIKRHFSVAKSLLVHMVRGSNQIAMDNLLLDVLFCRKPHRVWGDDADEIRRLAETLFNAGTSISYVCSCCCKKIFPWNYSFEGWMRRSEVGLLSWFRMAYDRLYWWRAGDEQTVSLDDFRYLLTSRLEDLRKETTGFEAILSNTLKHAVTRSEPSIPIIGIIQCAMVSLGDGDDGAYTSNRALDPTYKQACEEKNWTSTATLAIEEAKAQLQLAKCDSEAETVYQIRLDGLLRKKYKGIPHGVSIANYKECYTDSFALTTALKDRDIEVALTLLERGDVGSDEILTILADGDTLVCSELVRTSKIWKTGLNHTSEPGAMLYLNPQVFMTRQTYFRDREYPDLEQQICMRVVSYHAIATNDRALLQWLVHLGMNMGEHLWYHNVGLNQNMSVTRDGFAHPLHGRGHSIINYGECKYIPSLLAVAAGQDHLEWIKYIQEEGANMRDSMALQWAVKKGAKIQTIDRLLEAARNQQFPTSQNYGSAALRQALRLRRLDIAAVLCKQVDINAMEATIYEWMDQITGATPLCGAILTSNIEAARWLLEHGAHPDAYVSAFNTPHMLKDYGLLEENEDEENEGRYSDYEQDIYVISLDGRSEGDSILPLMTPLLVAIRMRSMPMIELLVEYGATINDTRSPALTRTPLQRAAEVGRIDFVTYFVNQHALVDTEPVYSGGTALQLAAMNGHVDVAAFLLEKGADPNHLPARGDGRTAFEAAVEWGHVDMVSLLMRSGVDLDLCVGDPLETQYERARQFAEENGQFASKRNAERIYAKVQNYKRSGETSSSSLRIGPVEELQSPVEMPEPIW